MSVALHCVVVALRCYVVARDVSTDRRTRDEAGGIVMRGRTDITFRGQSVVPLRPHEATDKWALALKEKNEKKEIFLYFCSFNNLQTNYT